MEVVRQSVTPSGRLTPDGTKCLNYVVKYINHVVSFINYVVKYKNHVVK